MSIDHNALKQREIYRDRFSNTFGPIHRTKLALLTRTITELKSKNTIERVLDLGCGDGVVSKAIWEDSSVEIVGCDISPVCALKAKQQNLEPVITDLSMGIPFVSAIFDMVTAFDIYEHLSDIDRLQLEIRRVLKPNALLVLTTPNLGALMERIFLLLGYQPLGIEISNYGKFGTPAHSGKRNPVGHIRTYTLKALKEFLNYYGFGIVYIKSCPLETGHRLINIVDKSIGRLFPSLSNELLIVSRKEGE